MNTKMKDEVDYDIDLFANSPSGYNASEKICRTRHPGTPLLCSNGTNSTQDSYCNTKNR